MKKILTPIVLVFTLLSTNSKLFSQTQQEIDYYNFDKDDLEQEAPAKSDNPFDDMMGGGDWGGDVMGLGDNSKGIESTSNMELAMTESVSSQTDIKRKDTFVKYDLIVNTKMVRPETFKLKGIWQIVYKEKIENHIIPFYNKNDQKVCLHDTILFASNYIYGATTCFINALFYDPKKIKIDYTNIKNPKTRDGEKKLSDTELSFFMSLYERFGIDKIPSFIIPAYSYDEYNSVEGYILDTDLIALNFNSTLYYLNRINPPNAVPISLDDPLETNINHIHWPTDSKGYKIIIGKEVSNIALILTSEETADVNGKLRILAYPPKTGNNTLMIYNFITEENNKPRKKLLYSSPVGQFHNRATMSIPLKLIESPIVLIDFASYADDNGKYPWGIKYKIEPPVGKKDIQ